MKSFGFLLRLFNGFFKNCLFFCIIIFFILIFEGLSLFLVYVMCGDIDVKGINYRVCICIEKCYEIFFVYV